MTSDSLWLGSYQYDGPCFDIQQSYKRLPLFEIIANIHVYVISLAFAAIFRTGFLSKLYQPKLLGHANTV